MRVHIRGQMGVQILQSFVALSRLHDDEEPIIVVNTAGLHYDATEKLTQVFDVKCEIRHQDEMRKTPYWEPGAAEAVYHTRERTLSKWLQPKKHEFSGLLLQVMHCRGGDKSVASAEAYKVLADRVGLKIDLVVSNDRTLGESVASQIGAEFNPESTPIEDWVTLLNASAVVAAPSAFVASTLVLDPNKRIYFAGESLCDGPYSATAGDLLFIDEMARYCKSVGVVG